VKYSLIGKKVLLVAPRFFGYEQEISDELTRRGASVDFVLDRPFDTPFLKAVTRLYRGLVIKAADRYYNEQVDRLGATSYDYVFVVNGQTLSDTTLAKWKTAFPQAKFVLYMWDSFGNRRWVIDNLKYFDHVFSFDRGDVEKFGLNFRPLFFSAGFETPPPIKTQWDLSFIGTAHTDRFSVISQVAKSLGPNAVTFFYLYLQAPWVFWLYKAINPSFRNARPHDFKFEPVDKKTVQEIFNDSGCILDVEHPKQTGLTMRTLETLGASKKLITTNRSVLSYDFFDARNICVIDRKAPAIPSDFLSTPYHAIDLEIYSRYRLEGWMDEILEVAQQ
jgi:hypothetical protein